MGVVNKLRAKATLVIMARGFDIENVGIPVIPKVWETFPNSKDKWIGVEMPEEENATACIYKAKAGVIFKPHIHKNSDEHFTITNKGGKVEVVTDTEMYTVEFPNSVFIPRGVPHAVKFITGTNLFIAWHPRMNSEDWDGNFLGEEDIKKNNNG